MLEGGEKKTHLRWHACERACEKLAALFGCYGLHRVALRVRRIKNVEIERLENRVGLICCPAGLIQLWWAPVTDGHDVWSISAEDEVQ